MDYPLAMIPAIPHESAVSRLFGSIMPPGVTLRRISLPAIIKPNEWPLDAVLTGRLDRVLDSPNPEFKSQLLCMTASDGTEFCLPAVAAIAKGLGNAVDYIGKTLVIKKTGMKTSEKHKRNFPTFDIFVSD